MTIFRNIIGFLFWCSFLTIFFVTAILAIYIFTQVGWDVPYRYILLTLFFTSAIRSILEKLAEKESE